MAKKEKSNIIKVPVYTTGMIEYVQDMFGVSPMKICFHI
jgi:hypothetical protein